MHGFRGSREGSPQWYPVDFIFDPPPEARARQHLLGDDGLAPYISPLVCRSFNVLYQGCFRRRKILESARQLSGYLLARLVYIRQSLQETEYNEMAKLSIITMSSSEEGVSGLSTAACFILLKQVSFPCQKRKMCYLILSGHVMREEPWRNISYCILCHELKLSAIFSNSKLNPQFVSVKITEERYPHAVRLCQCLSQ